MRFGCSIATRSSAFTVRCVAPKDQTGGQNKKPKEYLRSGSWVGRILAEQRSDYQELVSISAKLSTEPWTNYEQRLYNLQVENFNLIQEKNGFFDVRDDSNDAECFFELMEHELFESKELTELAIRHITNIHPQKRVAGVDGVHPLQTAQQNGLYEKIRSYLKDYETDDFRFDYIPPVRELFFKPWSKEVFGPEHYQRVCVCTMRDRVKQVITAWVMEPQCEACYAETNLFGYRPDQTAIDFVHWLSKNVQGPPVSMAGFEADVVSPKKVATFVDKYFPSYPFTGLRSWIESGLFELGMYPPGIGRRGKEQGCPILPILSNFLCHHLMKEVGDSVPSVHLASWYGNIIAMTPSPDEIFSDVQARLEEVADSMGLKAPMTTPVQPCHKDWVDFCEFCFHQEKFPPNNDDYSLAIIQPEVSR